MPSIGVIIGSGSVLHKLLADEELQSWAASSFPPLRHVIRHKPSFAQASPVAEEHPLYWAATRRAAALGRTADAQGLLGLHSAFARFGEARQRELVQPLVRAVRRCPHRL